MSKPLEIKVRLDRSQAKRAAEEHNANAKKMLDAMKASFVGQQKALIDSWKEIQAASKERLKQLELDEKETHKRIAAETIQRRREAAKNVARAQQEAAKAGADLEDANRHRALTNEEAFIQARRSMTDDENRKKIEGIKKGMAAFHRAAEEQKQGNSIVVSGLKSVGMAVVGVVGAYATLATATQIIATIGAMWRDQRKDIEASAEALHRQREEALAIAALKGNQGQSTTETAAQLEFRAKTLQTGPDAIALQEGMLNTGNAAVDAGAIKRADLNKLAVLSGQYASTNKKITPDAIGNLMGILPTLMGGANNSAEDVFRRGVGIAKTFEAGSSNPGPAMAQFQNNGALIAPGMYRSPEELAAVQSAFSSTSPNEAATLTRQFLRGTVGGLTRMRGSQFAGSVPQSEYLGGLGANDQMGAMDIARLIAGDLKKQEGVASAAGKVLNPGVYLTTKGYQDEEARQAVMGMSKMINSGAYDKTFGPRSTPGSAPTFAEAQAPFKAFEIDPVANVRRAQVAKDMANATKSLGPEEFYDSQKRAAFERLRGAGKAYGTYESWNDSPLYKGTIVDEVQREIESRAKKYGVPIPQASSTNEGLGMFSSLFPLEISGVGKGMGPLGGSPASRAMYSEADRAKSFQELNNAILAAGGTNADLAEQTALLKRLVTLEEQKEARARAGAGKPPPAIPPVRAPGPPPRAPLRP